MCYETLESLTGVAALIKGAGLSKQLNIPPEISKTDLIQDKLRGNHLRFDDLLTE